MNCSEIRALLGAHVDGELDLIHDMAVESHLAGCESCSRALASLTNLRNTLTDPSLRYAMPPGLAARTDRAIGRVAPANRPAYRLPWPSFSLGAAFACLMMLLWTSVAPRPSAPVVPTEDPLAMAVLASHVRALMANHLMDVPSTDQHTVKPWFNGKLDFSPPVQDFAKAGFPLIGGRLDYLDNRPVAALVYKRRRHLINLFVWPSGHEKDALQAPPQTQQGYHLFHWEHNRSNYWAVSDLGSEELREFVQLVQKSG